MNDLDLHLKLLAARDSKAVVVTTPIAVKAFILKFVELLHILDKLATDPKGLPTTNTNRTDATSLRRQVEICIETMKLFHKGVLLMDEVDLILHPLKSELNFPVGRKEPLDLTKNKLGNGLRWELPFFLLDAVFYATERQFPQHAVMSSQEAQVFILSLLFLFDYSY